MTKTVLLGAEGCFESEGLPYVREPSVEEAEAWRAELRGNGMTSAHIANLLVDGTGRPYWLKVVDLDHPECPDEVRVRISKHLRTLRLVH